MTVLLEQLIYVSRATRPIRSESDVSGIIGQSLSHNPANNITGALAFTETHFVQILEGSHGSLDVLLLKLMLDERHTNMEVLAREVITEQSFGDWAVISPGTSPDGQRKLVGLLADDVRSIIPFRELMLELLAEQNGVSVGTGRVGEVVSLD